MIGTYIVGIEMADEMIPEVFNVKNDKLEQIGK